MSFSIQASAQDARLTDSSFVALPGGKIEIRLDFDAAPPAPKAYMIDSPPRLVMDFWGVSNEIGTRLQDIETGQVDSLNFAQAEGRLRIVANLNEPVEYRTYSEDNSLFVEFSGTSGSSAAAAKQPIAKTSQTYSSAMPVARDDRTRVQGIDFERVAGGEGRVVVTLSDDEAGLDIIEEGNNVVVNLIGAGVAPNLEQRLDVQDFATPVMFIDTMVNGQNTSLLIKPSAEPYDYMAYQTGNQLYVDFKPIAAEEEKNARDAFPYNGEKIDLNFQDVSVRSILQIIAEVAEMNLVISDLVDSSAGNITLRLKNVPWDQALDIILKTKGLDKREVGNVLMIGTAQEIAQREQQELESQKQVEELAPLVTEFVQIDFRRASDLKTHIEEAQLISERGFVLADDQTNVLMIRETASQIEDIRRTLRQFDVEVAQILIEARIVEASETDSRELGIRWGLSNADDSGSINGNPFDTALAIDYGVDTSTTLAIGYASSSVLLAAELSALESDGRANIVSQPKVITTNGSPAEISSGQRVPYQTTDGDGGSDTEFEDVELSLSVTPQINPGDRISLDIDINKDSVAGAAPNGELIIDTNSLQTSISVPDGETVVLGGIFVTSDINSENKTPVLGDIPVLGNLFKSRRTSQDKQELLIFITPKLVRESLTVR
ncbi:type IV pilus secretin PilQ [Marinobacterium sp. YM272]|uniref:type IV pilus secretin PilQ n=1 Tax=Marinobacterium sp. YM272 TaxID=3421654 RepID=UPI003D7F963A